jgi:hypothetical protein
VTSVVSWIAFPSGLDAMSTEWTCAIQCASSVTRVPVPGPGVASGPDRLGSVRYLALLVLAVVFLTGLAWWVFFIGNAVVRVFRRH